MNWEILLIKYMRHVLDEEGVTFVEYLSSAISEVVFTPEEQAELRKIHLLVSARSQL
jgi:hypothetical protein